MKRRLRIVVGIAVAYFACLQTAKADLTFSFLFDQSNYTVSPDGKVSVEVFLRQSGTLGAGQTNILGGTGAVGMTGTGVSVTFSTGTNDAQVLSASDITGNTAFDNFGFGPFTSVSAGSALLSQATSGSAVLGTTVAPDTYDLLLGTFDFTAGGIPGQVTTISTSLPLFPDSNDNVANTMPSPTTLTDIAGVSATITVMGGPTMATPAPPSLVLTLTGAVVISGWVWRHRRVARSA